MVATVVIGPAPFQLNMLQQCAAPVAVRPQNSLSPSP
jgi:hypothetical protein